MIKQFQVYGTFAWACAVFGMILASMAHLVVNAGFVIVVLLALAALWIVPTLAVGKRKKRRLPRTNKRRNAARKV